MVGPKILGPKCSGFCLLVSVWVSPLSRNILVTNYELLLNYLFRVLLCSYYSVLSSMSSHLLFAKTSTSTVSTLKKPVIYLILETATKEEIYAAYDTSAYNCYITGKCLVHKR